MRHSHSLWNPLLQQPLVFPSAIVLWMLLRGKKSVWCWGTLFPSFVHSAFWSFSGLGLGVGIKKKNNNPLSSAFNPDSFSAFHIPFCRSHCFYLGAFTVNIKERH